MKDPSALVFNAQVKDPSTLVFGPTVRNAQGSLALFGAPNSKGTLKTKLNA